MWEVFPHIGDNRLHYKKISCVNIIIPDIIFWLRLVYYTSFSIRLYHNYLNNLWSVLALVIFPHWTLSHILAVLVPVTTWVHYIYGWGYQSINVMINILSFAFLNSYLGFLLVFTMLLNWIKINFVCFFVISGLLRYCWLWSVICFLTLSNQLLYSKLTSRILYTLPCTCMDIGNRSLNW